jgi:hypothetical protein
MSFWKENVKKGRRVENVTEKGRKRKDKKNMKSKKQKSQQKRHNARELKINIQHQLWFSDQHINAVHHRGEFSPRLYLLM